MTHAPHEHCIRTDSRQWLIHDERTVAAVYVAVRAGAVASVARRWHSEGRQGADTLLGLAGADLERLSKMHPAALASVAAVLTWGLNGDGEPPAAVTLEEVHAAVFRFDSRVSLTGVTSDGRLQALARGDDTPLTAATRRLRIEALSAVALRLVRHRAIELRAVGNVLLKAAATEKKQLTRLAGV